MKAALGLVVHIGAYAPQAFDGVAATIVGQCDSLLRMGVNLELWCFEPHVSKPVLESTITGIPLWRLPRHKNPCMAAMGFPQSTSQWLARRLPEVSLFHLHSVFSPINNLVAALGAPYVVTPNGGWGPRVLNGRRRLAKALWIAFREKQLWSAASFVQAVSTSEVEDLEGLPDMAKVCYVPNAVNLPPAPALDCRRDIWLFLGRLAVEHKGLDRMISAYGEAKKQGADLPKLIVAGPDFRGGRDRVLKIARSYDIQDWIELPGPVAGEAKFRLFERASLFIHTSRWEGMPLSILEAMSHEIPCLLTSGTNLVSAVVGSGGGLDAGDSVSEIAAAMCSAAASDLKSMGKRARECIERDFSWPKVASELLCLYREGRVL